MWKIYKTITYIELSFHFCLKEYCIFLYWFYWEIKRNKCLAICIWIKIDTEHINYNALLFHLFHPIKQFVDIKLKKIIFHNKNVMNFATKFWKLVKLLRIKSILLFDRERLTKAWHQQIHLLLGFDLRVHTKINKM